MFWRHGVLGDPVCSGLLDQDRKWETDGGARALETQNPPRISMFPCLNEKEVGISSEIQRLCRNKSERRGICALENNVEIYINTHIL